MSFILKPKLSAISQDLKRGFFADTTGTVGDVCCDGVANNTGYGREDQIPADTNPLRDKLQLFFWGEKFTSKGTFPVSVSESSTDGIDYEAVLEEDAWYNFYLGTLYIYNPADLASYVSGQLLYDATAKIIVKISAIQVGVGATLTPYQSTPAMDEYLTVGITAVPVMSRNRIRSVNTFLRYIDEHNCDCKEDALDEATSLYIDMAGVCELFRLKNYHKGSAIIEHLNLSL